MNLMIDGNRQEEFILKTNENEDNEVKTLAKADSARGSNTKRSLLIVSKQNIKLFPSDFFNDEAKKEGKAFIVKETHVKSSSLKLPENLHKQSKDFTFHPKIVKPEDDKHLYFDFHEEDKELLDMLKDRNVTEATTPDLIHETLTSPTSANRNKINCELKKIRCEIIPEEDEEKLRTEYRSSNKFFDLKNLNGRESMRSYKESNDLNILIRASLDKELNENAESETYKEIEKAIDQIYRFENKSYVKSNFDENIWRHVRESEEDAEEEDVVCLTYSNAKSNYGISSTFNKKSLLPIPIPIKEKRQHLSREKSVDSPSTREFTLDSAKNIKNIIPDVQIPKRTFNQIKCPSRHSSKNKLSESRGNTNNNGERVKFNNISSNSNSKIFNFNFLKNPSDFENLPLNTNKTSTNNCINNNNRINVFNTNPEKNIKNEKKNSTSSGYSAIAITNKNQNYPINLKYNLNTERDIKLKKEKSSTNIFPNTNTDKPLLSPRRKLNSNPTNSGFIEDKLQTDREKERMSSHKSQNPTENRKLNTDRGGSQDKQNLIRHLTNSKNSEYFSYNQNKARSQSKNPGSDERIKMDDLKKPYTPPEIKLKKFDILPAISTSRRKIKKEVVVYDISSVFRDANNFKEDPIVQKKMEDIIQNIDDIRNVISQKAKTRMKISSAPISHINQKYSFKGIPSQGNNDLNFLKNKSKPDVGDIKTNNLNLENKLRMVPGNLKKVPVKLKSMHV